MSENNQTEEEAKQAAEAAALAEEKNKKENEEAEKNVDYKAKVEALEKELGQAQHKIIDLKKKNKSAEPISGDDNNSNNDDDIDEKVKSKIEEVLSEDRSLRVNDTIEEELEKLSDNPDEKKLIKLIYENKIVKIGISRADIKKDLEAAKILANANKTKALEKEAEVADKNKPSGSPAGGQGGGSFASDKPGSAGNWSNEDQALLRRYGLDPNKVKNN